VSQLPVIRLSAASQGAVVPCVKHLLRIFFVLLAILSLTTCRSVRLGLMPADPLGTVLPSVFQVPTNTGSPHSAGVPVLFFSDLESGPNTGNTDTSVGPAEEQDGAIVTIWGARLGNSQGSSQVVCNGARATRIYFWGPTGVDGYQKVSFQVSRLSSKGAGEITIMVEGVSSNPLPFTVRNGKIYFVAVKGHDIAPGSFKSPWLTVPHARDVMKPGDITYVMDGIDQGGDDGSGWDSSLLISTGGTRSAPLALVAYPGAKATIGGSPGPGTGIRTGRVKPTDYWVIAGFTLRGTGGALGLWGSNNWRVVGNDISCPSGNGAGACFGTVESSNQYVYGNRIHDTGGVSASALYHGVYFGTDSNHIDFGWNTIENIRGCRGVQIHSTQQSGEPNSGQNQYDIHIHDNTIHDTQCDGIILDTIDPSKGPISVFNNVIYNAGKGPNNPEHSGGWSCINVRGTGSGMVDVYNNTLFSCGTFADPPYGAANAGVNAGGSSGLRVQFRNNIVYQVPTKPYPSGVPYLVMWDTAATRGDRLCIPTDNCSRMQGSNNLFFGSGPMIMNVANITKSINRDPLFVNLAQYDFHLTADSPAAHGGIATSQLRDHNGVPLPQGGGYPIGAYAYVGQP
jgi:hypothetical protein